MELKDVFVAVQKASKRLNLIEEEEKKRILHAVANFTRDNISFILEENQKDLSVMQKDDPMYDRLALTEKRILSIAEDIDKVAELPSPLDKELGKWTRPNGMTIRKVSIPFGVIGIIYEARPNVSFDVFSLCFKSGNACILKGGSNAHHSNTAIVQVITNVLEREGIDKNILALLPAGRESTGELLKAREYVDLIIPRGSKGLISFVRENSRIPVIETGASVCHAYFDEFGDLEKGKRIINNAKTRRVSVCNALDCVLVHKNRLNELYELLSPLQENKVKIYADERAMKILKGSYPSSLLFPATAETYDTEFLDYKLAVRIVDSLSEALQHIALHSLKHSETIISEDSASIRRFQKEVDAACVYSNVSTSFTDGGEFGFGAEIGISTQKLHARGPMALPELTSYKYVIEGNGQIRG